MLLTHQPGIITLAIHEIFGLETLLTQCKIAFPMPYFIQVESLSRRNSIYI